MERPFADERPVGPVTEFAQSDRFTNQLLGGSDSGEVFEEGNVVMIEVLGKSSRELSDMLMDVVPVLDEFVAMEEIGGADGRREDINSGRDAEVLITYFFVDMVNDPDVTTSQIEQFILQELQGSPASVFGVNIHKV